MTVEDLLAIASKALRDKSPHGASIQEPAFRHLGPLLEQRNGFTAYHGALLVLPSRSTGEVVGLDVWNDKSRWRRHYNVPADLLFFAQDVLAGQFGVLGSGKVLKLDPETGELHPHSDSIRQWAHVVIRNHNSETGWSLAYEWQQVHGQLAPGWCLLGRKPFVLGGEFTADNLIAVPMQRALDFLGSLALAIAAAPDGVAVTIGEWPNPKGPRFQES